jgi:hypothetical protein
LASKSTAIRSAPRSLSEPLERGHEAEVVERLRAQLDREPADVLERRAHELAQLRRAAVSVALPFVLERLEPEQDRRERLAGLVVQLAREPRPLELLRG